MQLYNFCKLHSFKGLIVPNSCLITIILLNGSRKYELKTRIPGRGDSLFHVFYGLPYIIIWKVKDVNY